MDLPQLGPVAVLLLKSGKSVACPGTPPRPETPSVTLPGGGGGGDTPHH